MGRKSKQVVQAELNIIRRRIKELKHDYEIAQELGITQRGLTKLKTKMYEQDKELWANTAKESLESRALRIMEALQECYDFNRNVMLDPTEQAKDRIEASQVMVQAQINVFQLLKQGPTFRLQLPYKVTELPEKVEYPRANSI